jgi:hypothetical protein
MCSNYRQIWGHVKDAFDLPESAEATSLRVSWIHSRKDDMFSWVKQQRPTWGMLDVSVSTQLLWIESAPRVARQEAYMTTQAASCTIITSEILADPTDTQA